MKDTVLPHWSRQQLRLAFYDFSVRGEGDTETVYAVIRTWQEMGALDSADASRWLDALTWRDAGGYLPGWTIPQPTSDSPIVPGEEHELLFEQWRATRHAATKRVAVAA